MVGSWVVVLLGLRVVDVVVVVVVVVVVGRAVVVVVVVVGESSPVSEKNIKDVTND